MGNKAWSILFGVVMAACAIGFGIAPFVGWWMPEGVSTHAGDVDFLFYVILYVTAFFFFLTEGILVAFMWFYAGTGKAEHPVSEKTDYPGFMKPLTNILHDQHRVELAWTFVPAVILLYIAFAQVTTWADIKYEARNKARQKAGQYATMQIGVSARQFEWRMRYPSVKRFEDWMAKKNADDKDYASFGKMPHYDDIYVVNELHIWKPTAEQLGNPARPPAVVVHLSTRDVIHSFNLPNFRVKQDALPGKLIPVYFTPTKANCKNNGKGRWIDGVDPDSGDVTKPDPNLTYDIACAELCGWGHYRMIGRVYVHKDQADFLAWLKSAEDYNRQRKRD